ncbi:MAG: hypothetical protein IKL05_00210 [Clostridia bacterium]|nr:hypothetical protein [Clostridia bacterium]
MKNIKFIAMLLAFIMMLGTLSSLVALPVLADGEDGPKPVEATANDETEEAEEEEKQEENKTSTVTVLSEDYTTKKYSSNEEKLATMELVYSDFGYDLYYQKETGEVQVVNTTTGQYLSTNPYDVASTSNKSTEREKLLSQLIVNYNDNGEDKSMTSYSMAALLNQITMTKIRGGIRVEYTIGQGTTKRTIPMMIEKSRFEEYVLAPLAESGETDMYNRFKSYYLLKDPNQPGLSQNEIQTLYNTLPITRQMAVYVIDPTVANVQRELNMFEKFITTYTNYTYDDVLYDHDLTGYTGSTKNPAVFRMALEYYLTEDGLEVRLPARGIRYDAKQYSLTNIKILPYFGAYNQSEQGYVVLPDGSGTLVRFEDTSANVATTITNRLYGEDYSFYSQKSVANMENWTLPIFGMVERKATEKDEVIVKEDGSVDMVTVTEYDSQGYLAIITEGDSLAEITTASGGILSKYFATSINVYPRPKDTYPLDGISVSGLTATWTVETDKKYTGNYRIKYIMLNGDDANYVNMATIYRNYLEKNGKLERQKYEGDTELYLETFGAVETNERVLGVPVAVKKPLTSFEDAKIMIDDLKKDGVTNLSIRYTGWANGGLEAKAPTKAKVEKVLGGNDGLKELVEYANENGVKIYPDYDFVYISEFGSGDKFNIKKDTVKTVDNRSASHRSYSPVYQAFMNDESLLISPNKILDFYNLFKEKYADLGTGTISLSTIGSDLNSDHNKENSLNREDSKERVQEFLSAIKEDGYDIMVDQGNAYTMQYATDVLNVPLDSSNRYVASEAIPLVGLVFHGYKSFAGSAINLAGDFNNSILKTIENGANLFFLLSYENTSTLKTNYGGEEYYSIRYDIWYNDMVETYKIVDKIMKPVQNALVVSHDFTSFRVVEMVYDNGITIVLDYNLNTVTVNDGETEYTVDFENDTVTANESVVTIAEFVKE